MPQDRARGAHFVACVDFGSTFTKAALVDVVTGELRVMASHVTTLGTDILDGWDVIRPRLLRAAGVAEPVEDAAIEVLACSSAGGGLRIAVVGNEELVTAEAGRRVALSSGGNVVSVSWGSVDVAALQASGPDVVLMLGGTDGGNAEVVTANAHALVRGAWRGPVVLACNASVVEGLASLLRSAGIPVAVADNVVPQIGLLRPSSARVAIRTIFLSHVIGGKHLSRRDEFATIVTTATPDAVLTAVELLAGHDPYGRGDPDVRGSVYKRGDSSRPGDVVVVDVGGATTDVYSVVELDEDTAAREVVAAMPVTRTVEADLGMRWSAPSTVAAAVECGLPMMPGLQDAADARQADPSLIPSDPRARAYDAEIARIAVFVALRRHAGRQRVVFGHDGRLVERTGQDLRNARLLIGSGGVMRHCGSVEATTILGAGVGDPVDGGWLVPRCPRLGVDADCVLAAAGLLAGRYPAAARALLTSL